MLVRDQALTSIVRRCYSNVEVRDRDGHIGRGFTNLKRIFGWPADLRIVVDALATTVGGAGAVASTDTGSAPLAALVAFRVSLPVVLVRSHPKHYFLSYGDDPATNDPRLSGERLASSTLVHVIDDFVHSGATLASAVETLREVGLAVQTGASLLASPPATIRDVIDPLHLQLTVFVTTDDL
jgi:adenine/guanine phosphoribosyltransferase-like PRPP-binding protein